MHRALSLTTIGLALALSACVSGPTPQPTKSGLDYEALMAAQPQPVTDTRRRVIEQARSLLGAPYKYGGTSPAGFDCTGFVQYVFDRAAGVALPRRSAEQIGVGEAVSPLEMQPGDLVYFNIDKEDSLHIGIYVGQGRFIHAPSTKGVVNIQSLDLAYWRTQFLGARRLVL